MCVFIFLFVCLMLRMSNICNNENNVHVAAAHKSDADNDNSVDDDEK